MWEPKRGCVCALMGCLGSEPSSSLVPISCCHAPGRAQQWLSCWPRVIPVGTLESWLPALVLTCHRGGNWRVGPRVGPLSWCTQRPEHTFQRMPCHCCALGCISFCVVSLSEEGSCGWALLHFPSVLSACGREKGEETGRRTGRQPGLPERSAGDGKGVCASAARGDMLVLKNPTEMKGR